MANLNKVMIIGNVGREPEMRFTPAGTATTTFSVAVNHRWNDQQGQRQEETEWFNVVTWDKVAESSNQYLKKGMLVYVEGRQRTRSWDGQDGLKKYRTELIAERVQFLDRREQPGPGAGPQEDDVDTSTTCTCGHDLEDHPEQGTCDVEGCDCGGFELTDQDEPRSDDSG